MTDVFIPELPKKPVVIKKHNFSAGPAILPDEVIAQAAEGVRNLNGGGLSVLEMSHRSKEIVAIFDEATALMKELIGLTADYEVVWLTGGASSQFFMVPMNLLGDNESAGYVDTGTWASKAIDAAKQFGKPEVLASSKATTYDIFRKIGQCRLMRNTCTSRAIILFTVRSIKIFRTHLSLLCVICRPIF